jgi:hypothetical protein
MIAGKSDELKLKLSSYTSAQTLQIQLSLQKLIS